MTKNKVRFLRLGFIFLVFFLRQIKTTDAFFSATAVSSENTITAGTVGFGGGGSEIGNLQITKYFCDPGVSVGSAQKPDSDGNATIPDGCTAATTSIKFKGTDDVSGGDSSPPSDDDFDVFEGNTDGSGNLTIDNLTAGTYGTAEFPASGERLPDDFVLGAFCSTSSDPFTNNYELAQISAGATTYCNFYNKMLFPGGGYTPPPSYSEGDVVINEVMWMGADGNSYDEWIELRNTTANSIELTGWTIKRAGSGDDSITIPGEKFIPANGYFLIAHYASDGSAIKDSISIDLVKPGISLKNSGEELILKDYYGTVIDQTPGGGWAAGANGGPEWKSMERNDASGDGSDAGNWHTCESIECANARGTFWDIEGNNYGTPKAENLSENDPSSENYISFAAEDVIDEEPLSDPVDEKINNSELSEKTDKSNSEEFENTENTQSAESTKNTENEDNIGNDEDISKKTDVEVVEVVKKGEIDNLEGEEEKIVDIEDKEIDIDEKIDEKEVIEDTEGADEASIEEKSDEV